jgi:hypothetical protein
MCRVQHVFRRQEYRAWLIFRFAIMTVTARGTAALGARLANLKGKLEHEYAACTWANGELHAPPRPPGPAAALSRAPQSLSQAVP